MVESLCAITIVVARDPPLRMDVSASRIELSDEGLVAIWQILYHRMKLRGFVGRDQLLLRSVRLHPSARSD